MSLVRSTQLSGENRTRRNRAQRRRRCADCSVLRDSRIRRIRSEALSSGVNWKRWLNISMIGQYGAAAPTSRQRPSSHRTDGTFRAARARFLSSATSRDLPIPASPTRETIAPLPSRASSRSDVSAASSLSLPINGVEELPSICHSILLPAEDDGRVVNLVKRELDSDMSRETESCCPSQKQVDSRPTTGGLPQRYPPQGCLPPQGYLSQRCNLFPQQVIYHEMATGASDPVCRVKPQ